MRSENHCLGVIETLGLSPALEAADTMLKSGKVEFVGFQFLGGAQVAVIIKGEVGPVQAAIGEGKDAAERKGDVLRKNVIARCDEIIIKHVRSNSTA
jgi:ethanolamine utilization protein EutM